MIHISLLLFSSLGILLSVLIGFALIRFSFKEKDNFYKSFLRYWGIAFLLLPWVKLPTVFFAVGFNLTISKLVVFFVVVTILRIVGALLLYRGIVSFLTQKKRWLYAFPLLIFIVFLLSLGYVSARNWPIFYRLLIPLLITWFIMFFTVIVLVRQFFQKATLSPFFTRTGVLFVIIGFGILLINTLFSLSAIFQLPVEFWFLAFQTGRNHMVISIAQVLILLGFMFRNYRRKTGIIRAQ